MSLLVFNEMIYTKLVPLITPGFLCCGTPKLTKKKFLLIRVAMLVVGGSIGIWIEHVMSIKIIQDVSF